MLFYMILFNYKIVTNPDMKNPYWDEGYYDTPYRFYIESNGIDRPRLNPTPVRK